MLFASEIDWAATWNAVIAFLVILTGSLQQWNNARQKRATDDAKRAAEETKQELVKTNAEKSQKLEEVKQVVEKVVEINETQNKTLDTVKGFVNGRHGTALEEKAQALAKVAGLTNDPEDHKIAEQAKKDSDEHKRKQAEIDKASGIVGT